jgi:hypothetical protein
MRKEKVINRLNVGERHFRQATVAAIEEEAFDSLAALDLHQHGVIPAGLTQDAERNAHV